MTRLMQQRKDLMRKAIYEAAAKILVEGGFEATTMDRVADEAGVAKGSLYNYFPNKLELLRFVHDKTIEPMRVSAAEIIAESRSAVAKLETLFRMWSEHVARQRGLFNFLFNEQAVQTLLQREGDSKHSDAIDYVAAIIEQGIGEGAFRVSSARQYAILVFGAVREMCDTLVASSDPYPADGMVRLAMDFSLHGLGYTNE